MGQQQGVDVEDGGQDVYVVLQVVGFDEVLQCCVGVIEKMFLVVEQFVQVLCVVGCCCIYLQVGLFGQEVLVVVGMVSQDDVVGVQGVDVVEVVYVDWVVGVYCYLVVYGVEGWCVYEVEVCGMFVCFQDCEEEVQLFGCEVGFDVYQWQ